MRKQIFFSIFIFMLIASVNCLTIQGRISSNDETPFYSSVILELQNTAKATLKTTEVTVHNGYFLQTLYDPATASIADNVVLKVNGQTFSAQIVNEKVVFDVYLESNSLRTSALALPPCEGRQGKSAQPTIGEIKNFTNETLIMEMDAYRFGVHSYENRLLIVNQYSVEEFDRKPDGSLERLSRFESRMNGGSDIDEDRLYVLSSNDTVNTYALTVFDLSQMPMQKLTSFNLIHIPFGWAHTMMFSSQHIMISSSNMNSTILYDKTTFQRVGNAYNFYGHRMYKKDNLIAIPKYDTQEPHPEFGNIYTDILEFFLIDEENNYELTKLSEIPITYYHLITNMEIQNGKFVVSHYQGVIIIDIDDIENPVISHYLWTDYPGFVDYAIYTEDYLYASVLAAYLYVYEIDDSGEFSLIYFEPRGSGASGLDKNLELHYPYLYMNKHYGLKVYDVSSDPVEVFFHGKNNWNTSYSLGDNDLYAHYWDTNYFLNNDLNATKYDIYSSIENKLVYSVIFDSWRQNVNAEIKGDLLFVSSIMAADVNNCNFEIYQINGEEIEFIKDFKLDHGLNWGFQIMGDLIFFNYGTQHVYRFSDYELEYVGSFQGSIQVAPTNQPKDYVINIQGNTLIFRDINDFENILFTRNVSGAEGVYFHSDEYLITMDSDRNASRVQNFDIENDYFNSIHTFPARKIINTLNGIIIKNAYNDDFFAEFYTIHNGQILKVGEKDETDRTQWHTFFFPEINKMAQFAYAGVWVYDFEYTVSEKDVTDPVAKINFELMGNYPNPFNPQTTISFRVGNALVHSENDGSHIKIDIYNIRGQKVRRLVDEFMNSGMHSVIWNGKNDAGREVSSGVYFYRMSIENDDFVDVKRMILLK